MKRLIGFIFITLVVLIGLVTISNTTAPLSDTDVQTVQLANRLYNNEDYDGAGQLYQDLVDSGVRNADIFYNLGNTYYQLGDNEQAILNFTRAQHLQPRDSVIDNNLRLAQESAGVTNSFKGASLFAQLQTIALTLNELALISIMSAFVTVIVWQARRIAKSTRLKQIATIALLFSMIWFAGNIFLMGTRAYHEQYQPIAILVGSSTTLNVPPGTAVQILEQADHEVRVIVPNTSTESWIPSDALELVS